MCIKKAIKTTCFAGSALSWHSLSLFLSSTSLCHFKMESTPPSNKWTSRALPGRCQLCVIQVGQTGDAPHVAAAATLDDNTDILVISANPEDKESEIVTYFKSVTNHATVSLERERVRFITLESTTQDKKARDVRLYNMMNDDVSGKRVVLKKLVNLSTPQVRELLRDQPEVR